MDPMATKAQRAAVTQARAAYLGARQRHNDALRRLHEAINRTAALERRFSDSKLAITRSKAA